ncbi:hypothetical protein RJT34_11674 [Clitoria ternatea]|uniref:Uncharacterized protein n=1 Tax=Clitoria ternatea TaxID=43366 RepID=A0AAN9JN27_CLITE
MVHARFVVVLVVVGRDLEMVLPRGLGSVGERWRFLAEIEKTKDQRCKNCSLFIYLIIFLLNPFFFFVSSLSIVLVVSGSGGMGHHRTMEKYKGLPFLCFSFKSKIHLFVLASCECSIVLLKSETAGVVGATFDLVSYCPKLGSKNFVYRVSLP